MPTSAKVGRLLFCSALLAHAVMLAGAAAVLNGVALAPESATRPVLTALVLAFLALARAFALSRLPAVASNARWMPLRPIVIWELLGVLALAGGVAADLGSVVGWVLLLVGGGLMCPLAFFAARGDATIPRTSPKFFLVARGHYDDWSARRHLGMYSVVAFLAAALLTLAVRAATPNSQPLLTFAIGMIGGIAVPFVQVNPLRGMNFLPFSLILLAVGALLHACWPQAAFPVGLLGFGAGLPVAGLKAALLMLVPTRQRFAAGVLAQLAAAVGGAAGFLIVERLPADSVAWIFVGLSLLATIAGVKLYFRELVELIMEVVFWPLYRFTARGPGLYQVPTRGPVLIIANHAAYFDPLFLGKVLPLRVRAMMISTMLDKPFLKWLAGDVYGAIRVPDAGAFRRETPELDEAVACLKRGENVMIFPEAWLRRKEEKPIHRFAQGVYRILKEVPDTPVLPCWIEDGWGSYLSYKNGPPTVNKKFDVWYRVRMGIGEPIVLKPDQLDDHRVTRRFLMELVLAARTYLGLPAHPVPVASVEEKD